MKILDIKNESELASILGMAFLGYANRVQNGAVALYKPFLDGSDEVYVKVRLVGTGGISVEEGPDVDGYEAEVKNLKRKVAEQEKEITSLNVLLEEQKPKEEVTTTEEFEPELEAEKKIIEKPERKRRRKKK